MLVSAYTDVPKRLFMKIINYIYDASYFQFDGEFYMQMGDSAMLAMRAPLWRVLSWILS